MACSRSHSCHARVGRNVSSTQDEWFDSGQGCHFFPEASFELFADDAFKEITVTTELQARNMAMGISCAQHLSEIFRTNKKPRSSHYKTFVVPMRHHWPLRKLCNTIRLWKRFICEPWESHQPVWLLLVECWKRIPHSKNPNLVSTTWWMPRPSPCLLAAFKRWFSLFSVWTCIDVTASNRSCFSRLYKVMGHSTTERLLWEQHEKKKI